MDSGSCWLTSDCPEGPITDTSLGNKPTGAVPIPSFFTAHYRPKPLTVKYIQSYPEIAIQRNRQTRTRLD